MRLASNKNEWTVTHGRLPIFLTPAEVAQQLNVARRTVYKWIAEGRIVPQRAGEKLLQIPITEVERFLEVSSAKIKNKAMVPVVAILEDDVVSSTDEVTNMHSRVSPSSPTKKNKPIPKGRRR